MLEDRALRFLKIISGIVLITWLVLPLAPLAIWSFARGWYFPNLLPQRWSLQAWEYSFSQTSGVLDSLWLTIWISSVVMVLSVIIGIPAGRALGLYKFKGKGLVEILMLAPTIVPGIAVVLGIHSVFITLGLNNSVTGVIIVHLIPTLPYTVLVMAGVFANYDSSYEDQARSLGASWFATLWYVTLPAVKPGIIVGALFAFLVSWSQYILTLMIGGGRVTTLPLLLFNFATSGRNDITGAIGMIYLIPGVLILIFTSRYLSGRSQMVGGLGRV